MEIITGYTGQNHIEADDVQALLRGIMGNGLHILDSLECFNTELIDANTVRINSGDAVFQGVHCRIPYGEYDTVSIANGSGDYNRTDVIALRYERDAETDAESVSWAYYQGGSDGEPPEVTEGSIAEGALVAEAVVFEISFDRMTPESIGIRSMTHNLKEIDDAAFETYMQVGQKADVSDVVYRPGDTDELHFEPVCGEVYANKTYLRFFVPFPRPLKGVTKVTITSGTYQVKANNAVIVSNESLTENISKAVALHPNGISIRIYKSSGFPGSANAVCAVSGSMTVKFSA